MIKDFWNILCKLKESDWITKEVYMEGLELCCFQIISAVGMARSFYIEAIQEAKKGKFQQARTLMRKGEQSFVEGHEVHATLIRKEASGKKVEPCLLLIHAEDQLMSAESFKMIADEMIGSYERIVALEECSIKTKGGS